MRQPARQGACLGLAIACVSYMAACGGCGGDEKVGGVLGQTLSFAEDWTAEGLIVGSRTGELYRFRLEMGVFEHDVIEVRGRAGFSSGVRCEHGTVLSGLEANGQRVSDLYCWRVGEVAESCGVGIGSSQIAGSGCELVAISHGSIRRAILGDNGSVVLQPDTPLEDSSYLAVGRRILVNAGSIFISMARGGFVEVDRHTGAVIATVSDADAGMSLLYSDEMYIVQGAPKQVVLRSRISKVVERAVSVRGIPVGIIRASLSSGGGVKYLAVVRFDDVLECDIVDLDTGEYVEVPGVSAVNVVQ
jgi:hypothetical protein